VMGRVSGDGEGERPREKGRPRRSRGEPDEECGECTQNPWVKRRCFRDGQAGSKRCGTSLISHIESSRAGNPTAVGEEGTGGNYSRYRGSWIMKGGEEAPGCSGPTGMGERPRVWLLSREKGKGNKRGGGVV